MRNRQYILFGILIAGVGLLGVALPHAFSQDEPEELPSVEELESLPPDQQREAMERMLRERQAEQRAADEGGDVEGGEAVEPAEGETQARPASPEERAAGAREAREARAQGATSRPAQVLQTAQPPTDPDAVQEMLTERTADRIEDVSDETLEELKNEIQANPPTNEPPPFEPEASEGAEAEATRPERPAAGHRKAPRPLRPTPKPSTGTTEVSKAATPEEEALNAKDRWKIPPEERTYFFSWKDTPFKDACDDFARMTGLSMIGLETAEGAKSITYRSAEVMTYNEALNEFNLILSQQGYWVVRREAHLLIHKFADWHRMIPDSRVYPTLEAFRAAALPDWEIVRVTFECKDASPSVVTQYMVDAITEVRIQADVIPGTDRIAITGPVLFVNRALHLAGLLDTEDPRVMRVYDVVHIKPSEAVAILQVMVDTAAPTAGGRRVPRPPRPGRRPTPAAGGTESPADSIEITPQDNQRKLYVRATPEKHEKVAAALAQIDVPESEDPREIFEIPLEHITPDEAIGLISPLVTKTRTIPVPVPRRPQKGNQPKRPQPPRIQTIPDPEGPQLFADNRRKVIIVRCKPEEFAEIESLAKRFDVEGEDTGQRVIELEYVDGNQLASTITQVMMGSRRPVPGQTIFRAAAAPSGSAIILTGEPEDVTKAEALVKELDVERDDGAVDYPVKLEKADAQALASLLQNKYHAGRSLRLSRSGGVPLPRFVADASSNILLVTATERQWPEIQSLIKEFDEESEAQPYTVVYPLTYASALDISRMLQQTARMPSRRGRGAVTPIPQFSPDTRTNAVVVHATEDYQKMTKELLAELDRPGSDVLRPIALEHADATLIAQQLESLLGVEDARRHGQTNIRIVPEPLTNNVFVAAPDEMFTRAKELAAQLDQQYAAVGFEERVFPLSYAAPRDVAAALRALFPDADSGRRHGRSGPTESLGVTFVEMTDAVVVRAPKDKMERVAEMVTTLDTDATGMEIRSWHLPGADVSSVTRTIQALFRGTGRTGPNIQCSADEASSMLFVAAPAAQMEKIAAHVEEIKTNAPKEYSYTVRYFPVEHGNPDAMANAIEDLLEAKFYAMADRAGWRRFSWGSRPRVEGDLNTRRIMVAATEDLMPLAEQLIKDMDKPPLGGEPVVRIMALKKGKAEELAPVIQAAANRQDYSSRRSPYGRSSWWRRVYYGGGSSGGSSGEGDVSVTAVPSSNSLLIRGPEERVEEAMKLAVEIDAEARPDGPVIKTFVLKHADVFDVQDTLEGLLGAVSTGGYETDYDLGSARPRRPGTNPIVVTADYSADTLIVAADYDKMPQVENLIQLKEAMAEARLASADGTGRGDWKPTGEGFLSKTIELPEDKDAEDIADQLQDILWDQFGFWDGPSVRAMTFMNAIVITAKADQIETAEEYLTKLVEKWKPRTVLWVKQVEGMDASKMAELLDLSKTALPERSQPDIAPLSMPGPEDDPERAIRSREIQWYTPIHQAEPAEGAGGAKPYLPTNELRRIQAAVASVSIAQVATTQPATTQPVTVQPVPAGSRVGGRAGVMDAVVGAHGRLEESGRPQIMYDDKQGMLLVVGHPKQVEEIRELARALEEQLSAIEGAASEIRVFQLEYVNVNSAATILETMFNESRAAAARRAAQQRAQQQQARRQQQRQQQQQQQQPTRGQEGRPEQEGRQPPSRQQEEEEEGKEAQAQPRALLHGERIRVFPDSRTQTLIVRAHPDDFREIAELILKIDRPSTREGIRIEIFQLKKLNAYEVEQVLKSVLKIDSGERGRRVRPMPRPRGGGGDWQRQAAMIEQLEQQVMELQGATGEGENKTSLIPSEQITITSDATTNSVVVSAPDEGMKLVRELIDKLEEKQIPLQVQTIQIEHADVADVLSELEGIFQGGGGGGRRRGGAGGEGEVTPARIGSVRMSADVRTNQLVVRALEPDFQKIVQVVETLDQDLADDEVVMTITLQYADASSIASALMATYTSGAKTETGQSIRISSDTSTNTIFVWAPRQMRAKIEKQVHDLDDAAQVTAETHQIKLTEADAATVADKLQAAFGRRGGRGKTAVKIVGDTASGVLFVTAPENIFKQINDAAKQLDTTKTLAMKMFQLQHAYAADVVDQFKELSMQLAKQLRPGSGVELGTMAVTPDPRTNTLFVIGDRKMIEIAQAVISQIDTEPVNPTAQLTKHFYLAKADASAVAATINNLFRDVPGQSVPPPRAQAEPLTNAVFVYATKPQLDQIETNVIKPLEEFTPAGQDIVQHSIVLAHAKVDDALTTITSYITERNNALRQAGVQRSMKPSDLAVSVTADPNTKQLIIFSNDKNFNDIQALVKTLDVEGATSEARETRVFTLEYVDAGSAYNAVVQALAKSGRVSEREQVTATPVYATSSVVVTASPENLEKAAKIVEEMDQESGLTRITKKVDLDKARASEVASAITNLLSQTRRRLQSGRLPATLQAVDTTNSIIVNATKDEMEQVLGMIAMLDVEPTADTERKIKTYVLEYANISYMINAINSAFRTQGSKNPAEQVDAFAEYSTNTLIVMANEENQKTVEQLIKEIDVEGTGTRKTHTFEITNAVVDDVYQALYSIYSQKRRGATEQPATITQLRGTNKILVTCTEKQYTEIEALIKQLDVVSEAAARVEIVNLHRISPQEAYNILIEFFRKPGGARWDATLVSDLRIIPSESTSSLLVTGREEGVDRVVALAKKLDAEAEEGVEGARETKVIALKYAYPGYAANAIVQALSKPGQQAEIDRITAVPETYTNTIIVSASEENMKKIDEIVAQLDRDPANAQTRHIVALKNAQADDVATAITQAYRYRSTSRRNERPVTVVPEANSNQLIVTCRPDEYEGVKQLIETLDVPKAAEADRIIKTFRLTYVEPSSLSSAINVAFQTRTGRQNPRDVVTSTYDYTSGTLIVVASKERMAQVEELVAEMDTESETKRDVHVVELQNADAADVANSLTQMFVYGGQRARGGQYAVQVTHIAGTDRILIKANDSQFAEIQGIVAKLDSPDLGAGDVMEVVLLEHADAVETESILQTVLRKSGGRSGQLTGDVRLSVSATSNAVVVSGGREQVDNVVKLVKTLDTESEGAGAPQRIELKYANASQLAETLRDVFTDPAQRRRGRSQEMVPLIIADEPSNSLIVRARLSDFTLISRMVEDLDREEMTGEGTIKVIAVDPGMNVTDLARELENTINEGQRLKAAQTPGMRPMQVSIGSDTRTNTLLVSGSPALYPEVEKLIKTLEAIKPASGTGVLILPLRNVSPDDLKRVIDQMQRQRQGRLRGRRGAVDSKDTALGSWLRSCA